MIALGGKRVLVTGGSRGIGAACCRLFAQSGATVCIHYKRDAGSAKRVLEECSRRAPDQQHLTHAADLGLEEGVEGLFESIEQQWNGLDCLVANAGIWVHNPIERLDLRAFETTWRLNVQGVFQCVRLAVPMLRASEDGNIVAITSTAAQRGEANYSPYAASKGALIAATKSWSSELAPEIRANSVAPGWVDTDMSADAYAEGGREEIAESIPLQRIATAEDIAAAVLFLASPLARHITGEILNVNGGSVLAG